MVDEVQESVKGVGVDSAGTVWTPAALKARGLRECLRCSNWFRERQMAGDVCFDCRREIRRKGRGSRSRAGEE